jgi:hypothetical protein
MGRGWRVAVAVAVAVALSVVAVFLLAWYTRSPGRALPGGSPPFKWAALAVMAPAPELVGAA